MKPVFGKKRKVVKKGTKKTKKSTKKITKKLSSKKPSNLKKTTVKKHQQRNPKKL